MSRKPASRPRRWLLSASGIVLIAAGCTQSPGSAQIAAAAPPVPAGQARVWFYRPLEPSESLNLAMVDMNGSFAGAVANGSAFYRDVPPGHYRIAPQSFSHDFNQDRNVDVAAGQQLYVKIVSLVAWGSGNSASKNFQRDAFYAWLMPPEVAQKEMARDNSSI